MEGVGARLGRSSSRYGPATVFTGPVRKWKKKWIHVTPSTDNNNNNKHHSNGNSSANGNSNDAVSHILLYKWTPIRKDHNASTDDDTNGDDNGAADEPPRRKMKYIPIALLEEQNNEAPTDEAKLTESDPVAPEAEPSSKPDMNDVPMEENQVSESIQADKSTAGLSLNLNARDDGDGDGDEDEDGE
ncbi:hypothetical protein Hdeb2414_s0006g00195671 [Helianthus debilis subsp. tardiflorus]